MRWWAARAIPASSYAAGDLEPEPLNVVRTEAEAGGSWEGADGRGRWDAAAPPGPERDSFGCGDSFAAGLTYGLGAGRDLAAAVAVGAQAGADCATRSGPYG